MFSAVRLWRWRFCLWIQLFKFGRVFTLICHSFLNPNMSCKNSNEITSVSDIMVSSDGHIVSADSSSQYVSGQPNIEILSQTHWSIWMLHNQPGEDIRNTRNTPLIPPSTLSCQVLWFYWSESLIYFSLINFQESETDWKASSLFLSFPQCPSLPVSLEFLG